MKKLVLRSVLVAGSLAGLVTLAEVRFTNMSNEDTAVIHFETNADEREVCEQKFNELVQKIEVTNRIILDQRSCKLIGPGSPGAYYSATIIVAKI